MKKEDSQEGGGGGKRSEGRRKRGRCLMERDEGGIEEREEGREGSVQRKKGRRELTFLSPPCLS